MTDEELTPEERKEAEDAINLLLNAPTRTDLEMFESARQQAIQKIKDSDASDDAKNAAIEELMKRELDDSDHLNAND